MIYPSADEICDGIDNNCNDIIDEDVMATYYQDLDGDGFGIQTTPKMPAPHQMDIPSQEPIAMMMKLSPSLEPLDPATT